MGHGDIFITFLCKQVKGALKQGSGDLVVPLGADDAHGEAVYMGEGVEGAVVLVLI